MNMGKNSREHYCGVPTKDELIYAIGEFSVKVVEILLCIILILLLL